MIDSKEGAYVFTEWPNGAKKHSFPTGALCSNFKAAAVSALEQEALTVKYTSPHSTNRTCLPLRCQICSTGPLQSQKTPQSSANHVSVEHSPVNSRGFLDTVKTQAMKLVTDWLKKEVQ
ncbi:hypothetical protein PoB_006062900 [Plakobranchus ocellatus]|uniref:Uncharacterized protein n=1 Tax=Plakobranchus ocellatus TaxID=259542 RepID=A0AAV4CQI9_9GAST|nr:hypothetical protein PoB_006062900 [Plakobranchus ocellatus]